MIELELKEIEKYFGANRIFENITFQVERGECVGLIGRNGTGKTTIFKIISGIEKQDKGTLSIRKNSTIGYLHQIPNYPEDFKVKDVLKTAFKEQYDIRKELKVLEEKMAILKGKELDNILKKYSQKNAIYEAHGGYEIEEIMSKVCTGLKFNENMLNSNFKDLSGGEKTIVMLGKILLQNPDLLLLDEPSNHLDMSSIEWLERYIKSYKGTVIVISHDRYFLDRVVTKIIEIDEEKTDTYNGNYSYYVKEKERRVYERFEAYKNQEKKISAMKKAIKQLRQWAAQGDNEKFFKRAESMQKRLDKIEKIDKPRVDKPKIQLNFENTEKTSKDVVNIEGLTKNFGNKKVLYDLNLRIRAFESVALIGNNGSGKSTILKILLGEICEYKGNVNLGTNVKIGYLAQNVFFKDEEMTVIEAFRDGMNILEGEARGILAKFLFYGSSVFKKVKNISGGEKTRLKLCKLIQDNINFLILDEPTNHLDIDSRENLEAALMEFTGTILFVSHDRYFINKIGKRICEIEDKMLKNYSGNYEYYKEKKNELEKKKLCKLEKEKQEKKKIKNKVKKAIEKNKKNKSQQLENVIQGMENQLKSLKIEMNENGDNYDKLLELEEKRKEIQEQLDNNIEKWMEIENS